MKEKNSKVPLMLSIIGSVYLIYLIYLICYLGLNIIDGFKLMK